MKTFTTSIHPDQKHISVNMKKVLPLLKASVRNMAASLCALLGASILIMLFVWAAGTNMGIFLGVATWGLGFVFLGVALDNRGPLALSQAMTGVALLALALSQSKISPDFVIVSGILLAAWVAVGLFQTVSLHD